MGLRDGGPPALSWAERSRSERESKAQLTVGPTGGDQPNIFFYEFLPIKVFSYKVFNEAMLT